MKMMTRLRVGVRPEIDAPKAEGTDDRYRGNKNEFRTVPMA